MTNFEIATLSFSGGSLVVSLVTLIIVFRQLKTANISIQKDHTRRERQATLEFLQYNFPKINDHYWELKHKYGQDRVWSNDTINKIEDDKDAKTSINEILDRIEFLSIGVYRGVYSFDVVYDFAELQLIRMHQHVWPIVLHWQEKYNREDLFETFDLLVRRIKEERTPPKQIEKI